jgi:hypothetical protein
VDQDFAGTLYRILTVSKGEKVLGAWWMVPDKGKIRRFKRRKPQYRSTKSETNVGGAGLIAARKGRG